MARKIVGLLTVFFAIAIAWISVDGWLISVEARRQFESAMAAQQALIAKANAEEHEQGDALKNLLKDIADIKKKTRTPPEIIKELPKYLPLPAPITIPLARQPGSVEFRQLTTSAEKSSLRDETKKGLTDAPVLRRGAATVASPTASVLRSNALDARLPLQDLKPLFDFVQDCRTCDAELDAARRTAENDSAKIAALTRERDLAVRAKNGSTWRRIRSNLTWLAFGVIAGYAATPK